MCAHFDSFDLRLASTYTHRERERIMKENPSYVARLNNLFEFVLQIHMRTHFIYEL